MAQAIIFPSDGHPGRRRMLALMLFSVAFLSLQYSLLKQQSRYALNTLAGVAYNCVSALTFSDSNSAETLTLASF